MRVGRQAQPKRPVENVIPMINVVFLLLVFFLITARITPPLPVEIEAPIAEGRSFDASPDVLVIGPDGTPYYLDQSGEQVWSSLAARDRETVLTLRVDRAMQGVDLAKVLARVSDVTGAGVDLVVEN